jgi:hypothetical protein
MWDLWWTKWRWGRFSLTTSVSPANLHSTNFSTITLTYHPGLVQYTSSGRSTQSPTAQIKKKTLVFVCTTARETQPKGMCVPYLVFLCFRVTLLPISKIPTVPKE